MKRPFFYRETDGIRIAVRPQFLPGHSSEERQQFVFAYFVRIENVGRRTVQLLSRYWHIHDDIGEDNEVAGEGVVGEQPTIEPGGVHEYNSFCILKAPGGYMEGSYRFRAMDDTLFDAVIPRFELSALEHDH